MNDEKQPPTKALADLVRAALESADPAVMPRDLDMILTIVEKVLHPRGPE